LLTHSLLPLLFVGLPSFYGAWLYLFFGLTQHAGMPENVLDHRLNCPHRDDESGISLLVLEHELPCGSSHVSDGALSCAARIA
jgi:hypothetical protein